MTTKTPLINKERAAELYHQLLHTTNEILKKTGDKTRPMLDKALEQAKTRLIQAENYTDKEINHIEEYLIRDLHSAGEYIATGEKELANWLQMEKVFIEDQLLDVFNNMVDHTRLSLDAIRERANDVGRWRTGEITGPGTLVCANCQQTVHFDHPSHIPPCPKCHETEFERPAH